MVVALCLAFVCCCSVSDFSGSVLFLETWYSEVCELRGYIVYYYCVCGCVACCLWLVGVVLRVCCLQCCWLPVFGCDVCATWSFAL